MTTITVSQTNGKFLNVARRSKASSHILSAYNRASDRTRIQASMHSSDASNEKFQSSPLSQLLPLSPLVPDSRNIEDFFANGLFSRGSRFYEMMAQCSTVENIAEAITTSYQRLTQQSKESLVGAWNEKVIIDYILSSHEGAELLPEREGVDAIIRIGDTIFLVEVKSSYSWANSNANFGLSAKFLKARKKIAHAYDADFKAVVPVVLNADIKDMQPRISFTAYNYWQLDGRYAWEFAANNKYGVIPVRRFFAEDSENWGFSTITDADRAKIAHLAQKIANDTRFYTKTAPNSYRFNFMLDFEAVDIDMD